MEVCYQLPVLPLDRPVPKHVLSRRGAISFSSSSSLFGAPDPRQLSQVNTITLHILHLFWIECFGICIVNTMLLQQLLQLKLGCPPPFQTTNLESTGISQVVVRYPGPHTHMLTRTVSMRDVFILCCRTDVRFLLSFITSVDNIYQSFASLCMHSGIFLSLTNF